MQRVRRSLLCLAAALAAAAGEASAQTKLLRFPDIHEDKVVFTYAGDLWTASADGGGATRLTAHPGLEMFAQFSPDGKWIAFTGQYDGDEQVYVIPAAGGVPKQLTWYPARGPLNPRWGYDNQVYGWTADGKSVFFRSLRDGWDLSDSRIYTVPVDGGLGEPLPMPDQRRRRPLAGRQEGRLHPLRPRLPHLEALPGRLGPGPVDLRPRHPRGEEHHQHPAHRARSHVDRRQDLLQLRTAPAPSTSTPTTWRPAPTTQLTQSRDWDVRWPSADATGQIVYEMDGELNVFDTRSGSLAAPLDPGPQRPARQPALADPGGRPHRGRRPLSQGRAGRVRGPRRRVQRPHRKGRDAQPHPHLRRARQGGPMVARRQEDRFHLRRDAARRRST